MHDPVVTAAMAPPVAHDQQPDAALIEAALTDPQAFGALYVRHVDRVYRYLYRQTGHRETTEDLTSLTFLRALAGLERFRGDQPVVPWLLRIAHNALVDHRRSSAGRSVHLSAETVQGLAENPGGAGEGMEQAEAFLAFTASLPAAQRDALALRFVADLNTEQTARALGRSVGATKMLVARAIAALRGRVRQPGEEGEP